LVNMTDRKTLRYLIHDSYALKVRNYFSDEANDFDYKRTITFFMSWFSRNRSAALPS
jgi:hypothetical protein